jgi:hypothetical protein
MLCLDIEANTDAAALCESQRSLHGQPRWQYSSVRLLDLGLGAQG